MQKTIIILLISLVTGSYGFELQFQADSLHGSLGDVIEFGWDFRHSHQDSLGLSEFEVNGTGIEILEQSLFSNDQGSALRFKAAIYDSVGVYTFPSFTAYLFTETRVDSLFLRGPDLEVLSILTAQDTTFRDIKGLHAVRMPINLLILVWIAIGLIIAGIVLWLFRRFKRNVEIDSVTRIIVPPEEAHIIALRELASLKKSKYLRFEQFKEFYTDLTHILKQYYENRYLVDALELTTSQLMEKMDEMQEFTDDQQAMTQRILEAADFVKFARGSSNEVESGVALSDTIEMVKETMLKNDQGEVS